MKKPIETALGTISQRRLSDPDVHKARKSLKKARACVRLLRAALPEPKAFTRRFAGYRKEWHRPNRLA